jgi:hypothetical protein
MARIMNGTNKQAVTRRKISHEHPIGTPQHRPDQIAQRRHWRHPAQLCGMALAQKTLA